MDKETKNNTEKVRRIMKVSKFYTRSSLSMDSDQERLILKNEIKSALNKKFKPVSNVKVLEKLNSQITVRYDTGDLIVITKVKQLVGYILTVTNKSPKKFRWSLVSKLHNNSIDALECLIKANVIKKSGENKNIRSNLQLDAYGKLKLTGYFALIAFENMCITSKQFEHISLLVSDSINLLFAWRKSDEIK